MCNIANKKRTFKSNDNYSELLLLYNTEYFTSLALLCPYRCAYACVCARRCVCVFVLFAGNTQANCDASERTVLKCNFPRNVNATQTDFAVYFKFDDGYEGTSFFLFLCSLSVIRKHFNAVVYINWNFLHSCQNFKTTCISSNHSSRLANV